MIGGNFSVDKRVPSVKKDLTFKLFQKFTFDAFFIMRTSFGHLVDFWKDTNKVYALSVLNNRVFFNVESSFVGFRRVFLFLAQAIESIRRFSIFFISGLPVSDNFTSFYSFHKKHMPLLGHGFMIHWLGGLLTNFHSMLQSFFGNSEAMLLKYKKQIKRDWFMSVQAGLRQLKHFPDLVCFFSVSGIYEVALKEAKILKLPTVAFVDSNCEVSDITFPVVSNDDSLLGLEYKILLFREFLLRVIKKRLFSEINALFVQNSDLRQDVFAHGMRLLVSELVAKQKLSHLDQTAAFDRFVVPSRFSRQKYCVLLLRFFQQKIFTLLAVSVFHRNIVFFSKRLWFRKVFKKVKPIQEEVASKLKFKSLRLRARKGKLMRGRRAVVSKVAVSTKKKKIKHKHVRNVKFKRKGKLKIKVCSRVKRKKLNKRRLKFKLRKKFKSNLRKTKVKRSLKKKFKRFVNSLTFQTSFFMLKSKQRAFRLFSFFGSFFVFFFRLNFSFNKYFFCLLYKLFFTWKNVCLYFSLLAIKNRNLRFFFQHRFCFFLSVYRKIVTRFRFFLLFRRLLVFFYRGGIFSLGLLQNTSYRFHHNLKIVRSQARKLGLLKAKKTSRIPLKMKQTKKGHRLVTLRSVSGKLKKINRFKKAIKKVKLKKLKGLSRNSDKLRDFLSTPSRQAGTSVLVLKTLVNSKLNKLKRKLVLQIDRSLQKRFAFKFKFWRYRILTQKYSFLSGFFLKKAVFKKPWQLRKPFVFKSRWLRIEKRLVKRARRHSAKVKVIVFLLRKFLKLSVLLKKFRALRNRLKKPKAALTASLVLVRNKIRFLKKKLSRLKRINNKAYDLADGYIRFQKRFALGFRGKNRRNNFNKFKGRRGRNGRNNFNTFRGRRGKNGQQRGRRPFFKPRRFNFDKNYLRYLFNRWYWFSRIKKRRGIFRFKMFYRLIRATETSLGKTLRKKNRFKKPRRIIFDNKGIPTKHRGAIKLRSLLLGHPVFHFAQRAVDTFSNKKKGSSKRLHRFFYIRGYKRTFAKKYFSKFFPFVFVNQGQRSVFSFGSFRKKTVNVTVRRKKKKIQRKNFLKYKGKTRVPFYRRKVFFQIKKIGKKFFFKYKRILRVFSKIRKKFDLDKKIIYYKLLFRIGLYCLISGLSNPFSLKSYRFLIIKKRIKKLVKLARGKLVWSVFYLKRIVSLCLSELQLFVFHSFFSSPISKFNFLFVFFCRFFFYAQNFIGRTFSKVVVSQESLLNVFFFFYKFFGKEYALLRLPVVFNLFFSQNFFFKYLVKALKGLRGLYFKKIYSRFYGFKTINLVRKFNGFIQGPRSSISGFKKVLLLFLQEYSVKGKVKGKRRSSLKLRGSLRLGFLYGKLLSFLYFRNKLKRADTLLRKRKQINSVIGFNSLHAASNKSLFLTFFSFFSKRKKARRLFFFNYRKKYNKRLSRKSSLRSFNMLRVF